MSVVPLLLVDGLTAGVAFVMSALFETSVLGSGVSWARKVRPSAAMITGRALKRAIDFMRPMLTDVRGRAKAISGRCACGWIERSALDDKERRGSREFRTSRGATSDPPKSQRDGWAVLTPRHGALVKFSRRSPDRNQ